MLRLYRGIGLVNLVIKVSEKSHKNITNNQKNAHQISSKNQIRW